MNVLVADDDSVVRTLVQRLVESWGYPCVTASDGTEAWEKLLGPNAPVLAILDWEMPGMSGVEIASKLRSMPGLTAYPYILLLTSRGHDDIVEALTSGADDYITKPFRQQELRARLQVGARIISLQRDLIAACDTAKYQASHDFLTGLLNRRMLLMLAQQELDRATRDHRPMCAILCDVDHFKRVNDTYGHLTGDNVLVEVARRIRFAVRSYEHVGRYGGEEFLVIAPSCDMENGAMLAERIREAVDCKPVDLDNGRTWRTTLSLGVALAQPGMAVDQLLGAADNAMYTAKHNGRNRFAVAGVTAGASV